MAIHRILYLSVAVLLAAGHARAAEKEAGEGEAPMARRAPDDRAFNPATLGKIEGILDFCGKVSGRGPSKDAERTAAWVGKASDEQLEEARDSSEYRDSYDEIRGQLDQVPGDQAQKACSELTNGK